VHNYEGIVHLMIEKCHFEASQASAVAHGTVIGPIGRLITKRKMRFSTSRPGKTNEYFETELQA